MMLNRAHVLLRDDRKDLRINENGRVSWQIKYKQRKGQARIRNISATGMQIETDTAFDPNEECIFSFDSRIGKEDYIPQIGRLVWHRKKRLSGRKYLSGIKFLEADEQVLGRMRRHVKEGIVRFLRRRRVTTTIGFLLCLVFIVLMEYVVALSGNIYRDVTVANEKMLSVSGQQALVARSYANKYQNSQVELTRQTEKLTVASELITQNKAALVLFAKELEATGALLNHTEMMLTQSSIRNTGLNKEILDLQVQVRAHLTREKSAVAAAGAKLSMAEYRNRLRSIKSRMRRLKVEERVVKVAAIALMDSQKSRLGNNGYFVRQGQAVEVDQNQYQRITRDEFPSPVAQANRKVEIDVTFFE